jgi:hypothetical protein
MAPTKKDKTKTKKLATEKKSSDDAASKEIVKETKRSTRTPSSKKLAKDKRKSLSSSSAQKKMRQNSTLRPIKVRLLDGQVHYAEKQLKVLYDK